MNVRLPALVLSAAVLALVAGCDLFRAVETPPPPAEEIGPPALATALPSPDRPSTVDTTPIHSEPLMPEPTFGAERVRLGHNPSGSPDVDRVKREGAQLIDSVAELAHGDKRLQALAITAIEDGVDWAVKALTANADPVRPGGSQTCSGDSDEVAELRRQITSLDEQLAATRKDRDAFAAQASARDRTIEDLRFELDRRPERPAV